MEMKNITISDIAEALDLSQSTIDRVINNRENVAEKTRKKVMDYINEINYKPNKAAKHLAKKTKYTIGISYFLPKSFAKEVKAGINRIYDELKHYGLNIILNEAESPADQMNKLKDMEKEIDALLLVPGNQKELKKYVNNLINKDIYVATFNRNLENVDKLFYYGCNYYQAGKLSGEVIGSIANEGTIAIIGDENEKIANERISGFKSIIKNYGEYNILKSHKITGSFDLTRKISQQAVKKMINIINSNSDLTAIYVVNQTLTIAAEAMLKTNKVGKIKLIGFDLFEETVNLIENNIVQAVICQEPFNQGYYPIKLMFEFLADNRELKQKDYITKLEVVMKENLKYYNNNNNILL